jgi:TolB-like protein/DNA-binding winged helix-turn-helix (wHTH) protein/Tfp pilus assembly protein PilF
VVSLSASAEIISFGEFEADLRSRELRRQGSKLRLPDQSFQVLAMLLEHPGDLISREEIRKRLWPEYTFVDFDHGLNNAVNRLREALGDSAASPRLIETLPRRGYRFIGTINGLAKAEGLPLAEPRVVSPSLGQPKSQVVETSESAVRRIRYGWIVPTAGVFLILLVAGLKFRHHLFPKLGPSVPIRSLVVLPFENLSGDPSQEYFADGVTDTLITDLAQIGSLRVISRTSAMHYKGSHQALPGIVRELNVDAVVEGSVVRSGDRVRITAQLVQAPSDRHIWAKSYDRKISDILSLQGDVAREIAKEVQIKLTPEQESRLAAKARTVDPKIYESYLKGLYFSNRWSEDGLKRATAYFQEAIQADPEYAAAYAGLADCYTTMGFGWADIDDPDSKAIAAAQKALSLDSSLADAHASLAFTLHRYKQNWTVAEKEYRRALELNPNYATAHRFYGVFLDNIGRRNLACDEFQLAHQLDPLNLNNSQYVATCLYDANHFEEAVQMMKNLIEMDPNLARLRWTLGDMYERKGMFPKAIEQYQKGVSLSSRNPMLLSLLASAYAGSGRTIEAEKLLEEIKQKWGEDTFLFGAVYARMGRKEDAIRELQKDARESGPGSSLYRSEWRFDSLRSDPRFQAILKQLHYPETEESK